MDLKTKVSPHFAIGEFIETSYGGRVDKATGKTIRQLQLEFAEKNLSKIKPLCEFILEPIREYMIENMGMKSLIINSGFRCPELNNLIPGASPTSQHSHAEAVDINCSRSRVIAKQLYTAIIRGQVKGLDVNKIGQCILEATTAGGAWVHISYMSERYAEYKKTSGKQAVPEFLITFTGKRGEYYEVTEELLNKY